MTTPAYVLHRMRYATAYRIGLPALGIIARILPTRTILGIADHYRRAERRAAEPHRYAATYRRNRRCGRAVGIDRYDIAADAGVTLHLILHRRALRAVHRLDMARAAVERNRN